MSDDLINRPLAVPVMTKGPWPRQVTRAMAIAMADLGIENFDYIGDALEEDGGDFGKGCFVRQCRAGRGITRMLDGGKGTRWCVGVEYANKVAFTTIPADPWKQIDAFTERVLSIPGWQSVPTLPMCRCGAPARWLRTYGPSGGYGAGIQAYFIWDEGTERADLEKREKPSDSDGERRRAIVQLETHIGMANLQGLAKTAGGPELIDRWCSNGRSQTRDAIAKEALKLLGQRQWRETV